MRTGIRKEHSIEVAGTNLHCRVVGKGIPILFIHGFSQTNRIFEKLERHLEEKYQLILVDSRGHGKSGMSEHQVTTRLMAQDMLLVLDSLTIPKAYVIGFSDGANIALQLAVDSPERLLGIVCISANTRPEGLKKTVRFAISVWNGVLAAACFLKIPSACRQKQLMPLLLSQPQITQEQLGNIAVRALLIWGERDFMKPEHIQEIGAAVHNSQKLIVASTGHFGMVGRWERYIDEIEQFVLQKGNTN